MAERAGVAISTVSKVLNHYPNVSEKTRRKVESAVAELNFVPNSVASALSSKKSGRVALVLKLRDSAQTVDEISLQYLSGAIPRAVELSLDAITIFYSMIAQMSLEELVRYFQSQSIAGLVIFGLSKEDKVLHQLIRSGIFPIVLIDAPLVGPGTSVVWVNQEQAQYEVVKKTADYNHCRSILYLAGRKDSYVAERRLAGARRFAEENHISLLVRNGDFSEKQAREWTFRFAKNKDMVACASDMMAIGAMKALMEMDIFRPVCGFDGIPLMGYAGHRMNTVRQDFAGIAARSVTELKRLLDGGGGREVIMKHELVRMRYEDVLR